MYIFTPLSIIYLRKYLVFNESLQCFADEGQKMCQRLWRQRFLDLDIDRGGNITCVITEVGIVHCL